MCVYIYIYIHAYIYIYIYIYIYTAADPQKTQATPREFRPEGC